MGLTNNSAAWKLLLLPLAGALQTLSLAPFGYWLLGPLSIALILWSTKALTPDAPGALNRGALNGWLFGLGLFGSGASWVYVSIHVYGYASPALATALTLVFVTGLAIFPALYFWLFYRYRTESPLINALLFCGIWVLGDGFRTVFMTGFPWLFLGYGHLESPLSGWVPVLGVYGLTLIAVASGAALALLIHATFHPQRNYRRAFLFGAPVLLFWISGPFINNIEWATPLNEPKQLALLQTNIPQELKWEPEQRRKTLQLLDEVTREHWDKDLIIWPETAVPLLYDQALPYLDVISAAAKEQNTSIITGIPFRGFDEVTGQTVLHNSIASIGTGEGLYHKQKLVPFGEYVPLQELLRGLIAFFDLPMSDFRKGPAEQALLRSLDYGVAPFICYEVVYPDFVAKHARNADILLTISNDAWFGESIGPLQHLEMAQMRAAENARYMIRATNNGVSAVIDHHGRITAQSEQFVRTVLTANAQMMTGSTPYSVLGSYPTFFLSLLMAASVLIYRRKAADPVSSPHKLG